MTTSRRQFALLEAALGAIVPVLVAMALVPARGHVEAANIALLLMVVVVGAAAAGGRAAGVAAGVTAAIAFDFFHTKPYNSFTIERAADVETALLMLAAGLVVGYVAARSTRRQAAATEGKSGIGRIRRLADLAAQGADSADVIMAAQAELIELLRLQDCIFEAPPFAKSFPQVERTGVIDSPVHPWAEGGFELPAEGVALPVLGRGHVLGRFLLDPTPGIGVSLERRVVAVALADQVGAALAATPGAHMHRPAERRLRSG
jgi:hypothetical protein